MTCGCLLSQDEIQKRHGVNRCPKHRKGTVKIRRVQCIDCGKKLDAPRSGGLPYRCPACRAKHEQREQKLTNQYRNIDDVLKEKKLPVRCHDCIHYALCLDPERGSLIKHPGACEDCPYYKPRALDAADYIETVRQENVFGETV